MEVNELRIGNITKAGVVYEINEKHFYVRADDGVSYKNAWAVLLPEPVTEEWLIKLGFTCEENTFYVMEIGRSAFSVSFEEGNHIAYRHDVGLNYFAIHNGIDYVHQLQNLFFALTGKELKAA